MPINPNNEARDLVMSVFGGMSMDERNQVQIRVRRPTREAARFRAASVDAGEKVSQPTGAAEAADAGAGLSGAGTGRSAPPWSSRNGG